MSKMWGISSPLQIGGRKPPFWTISQLNGKFSGVYIPNETQYRQSGKCVDNQKGSATWPVKDMNFGL